ncbi:hypothetical protein PLICRDRAFT_46171 [Plicaturopsis crispa FD-325 SS-3]|uniref:Pentulose kinase n=1 Tax=Plicaturopsis crispa FD-325 SS-3 TaxID=944288 RepID=A0A0C9SXD9_PLICR|nr:hypothetical protein PLICRDRAFT_46171 [Plicaturopsis crispa FD-325 SS-3]
MAQKPVYYLGIDVGTSSARVVFVDGRGRVAVNVARSIETFRDPKDHRIYEQSTGNIWQSICDATHEALSSSKISPEDVRGVGIDATCSLVVVDAEGSPVAVSGVHAERNVVLWCDHRAESQTRKVNEIGHEELRVLGCSMDLELDVPKLMWLRDNLSSDVIAKSTFFCLPDYLAHRATATHFRPLNATPNCPAYPLPTTHYSPPGGWSTDFFHKHGLSAFAPAFPHPPLAPGSSLARGLDAQAATDLGLLPGIAVGAAVVDCYSGYFATIAAPLPEADNSIEACSHRIAAITGTSTCFVVQSPSPVDVHGVWGPLKDALFPGWYMSTGGQSATGELISHVVTTHPAYAELLESARSNGLTIFEQLDKHLERLVAEKKIASAVTLAKDVHLYPDFHGNRAPLSDAGMRGMWVGLTLDTSINDLAIRYQATLEALALQFRHIFEEMNHAGHDVQQIFVSGGQTTNRAFVQLIADVCRLPVVLPDDASSVAKGSAILGRYAAEMQAWMDQQSPEQEHPHLWKCMTQMTQHGDILLPSAPAETTSLLECKYRVFREMIDAQRRWTRLMRTS